MSSVSQVNTLARQEMQKGGTSHALKEHAVTSMHIESRVAQKLRVNECHAGLVGS